MRIKTYFNSFVHSLALGQRVGVTWKWPITACFIYWGLCFYCSRGLLDARLNNYAELLRKKIPLEWLVMLIFDNINIYKGHSRHIRLKKSTAPSMWNFTVRAALKPIYVEWNTFGETLTRQPNPKESWKNLRVNSCLLVSIINN